MKGSHGIADSRSTIRRMRAAMAGLAAFMLAALCVIPSNAQISRLGFGQFKHSRWTPDDGAPTSINGVVQTPDGYLWVASVAGLYRFDGVTFERFPGPPGSSMARTSPSQMFVSRAGELWVGYAQRGGVAVYRGGQLRDMRLPKPPPQITELAETDDGAIWAVWGGAGTRLNRLLHGRWAAMDESLGLPRGAILSLLTTRDGTLWAALMGDEPSASLLAYLPKGERRFRVSGENVSTPRLALDPNGNLWVSDQIGTRMVRDGQGRPPARRIQYPPVADVRMPTLAFDAQGGIWGATRSSGIFYIPDAARSRRTPEDRVRRYLATDGLTSDATFDVMVDREGSIWVASELGLDRFRVAGMVREPAIPSESIAGLHMAGTNDGTLYVTAAKTLFEVAPGQPPRAVLAGLDDVVALCAARGGGLWLIRFGQIVHIRRDGNEVSPGPAGGADATSCAEDRFGRLWLPLGEGGMLWRDRSGWHRATGTLAQASVWDMVVDPSGDLAFMIGLKDLARLRGNRLSITPLDRMNIGQLSAIVAGPRDVLISGADALVRVRGDRLRRLDGAKFPWVARLRGIVQTRDGDTWLQGLDGISRVSTAALDRAFDQPGAPLERTLFDMRDGLTSLAQHFGFRGLQAAAGADGKVWFLNRAGAVFIDPKRIRPNVLAPPVVIRSLAAGGDIYRDPETLTLEAGTSSVDIGYTALSLAVPQRVRFRYRLEGIDDRWIDPGTRREASYANLGPGHYRFHVIAANDDGVWNRAGATLEFDITPTFVQSWPFKLLCGLVVLGLLWLAYSLRLRTVAGRIRLRMTERIGERERIARELHDTLLQSVQALIVRFQLAADDIPADQPARRTLEEALDRADDVLAEGRDRVRDLRPRAGTDDIQQILRDIARKQAFDPAVDVRIMTDGEPRALDPLVFDEVARIANEALFNIWRHSQANEIEICVGFRANSFSVRFRDNGIGIAPSMLENGGRDGHFGLAGMRERAASIEGELTVENLEQGGTAVTLIVPARIAYASSRGRGKFGSRRRR